MGRVFSAEKRHVLLIDEIDKADLEFPNDILRELDEMQFTVMETGDEVKAKESPVVIITSNNEKELPDAFLRRCVFHFIDFPTPDLMKQIVDVHHPNLIDEDRPALPCWALGSERSQSCRLPDAEKATNKVNLGIALGGHDGHGSTPRGVVRADRDATLGSREGRTRPQGPHRRVTYLRQRRPPTA